MGARQDGERGVKRLFQLLLLAVLLLAAVVMVRTLRFASPPETAAAAVRDTMVNERAAAERLARAVRFATVSWSDSAPAREPLLVLHRDLQADFPLVHRALTREVVDGYSLLYTWRGADSSLAPVVLMGHLDVVPVEAAVAAKWRHGPFSGDIDGGFIWGRGTLDDKVSVLAALEAVETLLAQGFTPARTVILAFGHDEEVAGHGADSIVQRLRARGIHPAFVLDEGGAIADGILPGVARPVALVGIAEKGYVSVALTVEGTGGHSSMPPPETAVGVLARAIVRLEDHPFPGRLAGPAAMLFDVVARTMPFVPRMIFANQWLFGPLLLRRLESAPTTNALVRTTTAPTMIEGSPKDNVLPGRARAIVNFRILPGDSVAAVIERVRRVVADPRVDVRAAAGQASDPSPVSGIATLGFRGIARAAAEVTPGVIVAPWLVVGATDARHYAAITPNAYRFLPLVLDNGDLGRVHGVDERVSVAGYAGAVRFMRRLVVLTTAAGAAP
jgi:carboxypeptidase PM20D1